MASNAGKIILPRLTTDGSYEGAYKAPTTIGTMSADAEQTVQADAKLTVGGTVGFDADVNPHLTPGLAAMAMYGDFTAESPDRNEGDVDTQYVTTFARVSSEQQVETRGDTDGTHNTCERRRLPRERKQCEIARGLAGCDDVYTWGGRSIPSGGGRNGV